MILADVSFIDIFWSMLWFFFLFLWIMVLAHILADLFRDRSLSGVAKALWVVFLVFLPFLAALIYFMSRGREMADRAIAQQRRYDEFAGSSRSAGADGDTTPADQIARARDLLDAGTIDQSEFERLKAKALS